MAEATDSLRLPQLRASMALATNTLARQRAIKEAKRQLQAQGLRPSHFSHRDLVIRADAIPRSTSRGANRGGDADRRTLAG